MIVEKKIYFASDLHLGIPSLKESLVREKHFVKWLDQIAPTASELYLMGDVFDFWFEYKKAVPKGYIRLLGKLAELSDSGIKIHYFVGNHDLWLKDYFPEQLGIQIYHEPITRKYFGKTYYLAHGDGLGPGDHGYKFLKKIFTNPFLKWSFGRLHPNFGIGLAGFFSKLSRKKTGDSDNQDYGEKEFLLIYSKELLHKQPEIDYFVFGHRHFAKYHEIANGKFYINLGDWINQFTYLEVSNEKVELLNFPLDSAAVTELSAKA